MSHLRRRMGFFVAREFARHRLRRVPFIGVTHQAVRDRMQRGGVGIGGGGPAAERLRVEDFYAYQAHMRDMPGVVGG